MTSYPIAALILGVVVALSISTAFGGLLSKLGFPLRQENRYVAIDGLRGYLALLVLAHHFVIWLQITRMSLGWEAPAFNLFNQFGAGAVALFFMTTGFLFYPLVLSGWRAVRWRSFIVRRFFRIEPIVAVSFVAVALVVGLRQGTWPDKEFLKPMVIWLSSLGEPAIMGDPLAGRVNAFVLWSLRYEWIFYLAIVPLYAVARDALRNRCPTWAFGASLVVIGVLRMITSSSGSVSYLPLFGVGMLAYEVRARPNLMAIMNRPIIGVFALLGLFASMFAFSTPYAFALPGYAFFFVAVACGNTLGPVLRNKGAQVLGACSFAIYATHGIALSLLFTEGAGLVNQLTLAQLPCLLPLVAMVMVGVSALLHVTIEMPGMALGRFLTRS